MKKNMANNKIFIEFLSDNISQDQLFDYFSKEKIKLFKQNRIKTTIIISSEPVDSQAYLSIINNFSRAGIRVLSLYFNPDDLQHIDILKGAIVDFDNSLKSGACLLVSYRTKFTLPFLASYHIYKGKTVPEAVASVRNIKRDSSEMNLYLPVLERFASRRALPVAKNAQIRNAIKIAHPSVHEKAVPGGSAAAAATDVSVTPLPAQKAKQTERKHIDSEKKSRIDTAEAAAQKSDTGEYTNDIPVIGKGPFYRSIRFKLISIISIIIMASLTGMIFLASYFFKNDNLVRIQESNLQISEVIALKIKSEIEKYQLIGSVMLKEKDENLAGYENLIATGSQELFFSGILVKDRKTGRSQFTRTFYNAPLMNKYIVSRNDLAASHESYREIFDQSFSGVTAINNASQLLNSPAFVISYPHERGLDGNVASVMVSYVRLDNILKTFTAKGITTIYMVNYKGDVIAHPDKNLVKSSTNMASVPICAMMMKSKADNGQTRYRDESGIYYLGSFKKIDTGGFGIIASAEESKAFQAVYDIQFRNILITAMILVAAIMIIFFFGKTITNPIIRLVGATKKIIEGQYRVDIAPTSKDEIGELTSTFIEMGKGLEEREKIKSAFGKFVNKEIAEAALHGELRLGGERKTVTILFSDIRAFTAISEKLEPEEVVEFLNAYMTKMVACVEKSGGVVDKFIGDAIMAVWGTPISRGNDTENALNGALMMRTELIEFNRERGGPRKPYIRIGCGINTGEVLAGQIGSEDRMEYTVIGDPVNLASRIEALNKPFGTDILISEDTYKLVRNIFAVEKMKQIRVKGKIEPQQIYAVLGRMDDPSRPKTLPELQALIGIEVKDISEEAIDEMINRGEEKYEIIEK